jgi:hypothetical protein
MFLYAVDQLHNLKHFGNYFAFSPKSNDQKEQRKTKK